MLADVDRYWTGDGNCAQSSAAGLLDYYGFKTEAQQFYNAFYPYGGGMRMCLGMHLARMEITTIIALFIAKFEFKIKPGVKVNPITYMTLKPKEGISLIIKSVEFVERK